MSENREQIVGCLRDSIHLSQTILMREDWGDLTHGVLRNQIVIMDALQEMLSNGDRDIVDCEDRNESL